MQLDQKSEKTDRSAFSRCLGEANEAQLLRITGTWVGQRSGGTTRKTRTTGLVPLLNTAIGRKRSPFSVLARPSNS